MGKSLALRIPKVVAKQANVYKGARIDLSWTNGKIVLRPMEGSAYHLASFLKKVNKKNIHKEISFGKPLGKEV